MIETMPGGIAVFDYDGDGRPDIYFTNGADIPSLEKSSPKYWNRLYRNEGNWKFRDVTEQAGVAGAGYSMGAAVGDFDNDGHPDLFVAGVNRNLLYRNRGDGTFEDVTAKAGIRERRVGRGCRLVRLRSRWQARSLGGPLCEVVHRRGPVLRRRRARHPHLLPSEIFHRPRQFALSQSRRRHVRGRDRQGGLGEVSRPRHERRVRRLRSATAGPTSSSPTTTCRTSCSTIWATASSKR